MIDYILLFIWRVITWIGISTSIILVSIIVGFFIRLFLDFYWLKLLSFSVFNATPLFIEITYLGFLITLTQRNWLIIFLTCIPITLLILLFRNIIALIFTLTAEVIFIIDFWWSIWLDIWSVICWASGVGPRLVGLLGLSFLFFECVLEISDCVVFCIWIVRVKVRQTNLY